MAEILYGLAQVAMIVTGLAVAGHIHCAANFLTKAPHYLKAFLMPVTVAAGTALVWAGVFGNFVVGGVAAMVGCAGMAGIMFAAWGSGSYLSTTFRNAYEVRQMDRVKLYEIAAAADGLVTPSGLNELIAQEKRQEAKA